MAEVVIAPTGVANLASIRSAFALLGVVARVAEDAADVERASRLVLPGVGAFAAGMETLQKNDLAAPIRRRVDAGQPTLAVCLGLQLLAEGSEEADGVPGLGVFSGTARRFSGDVVCPHMGWNEIDASGSAALLESGRFYFANSYRLDEIPAGWSGASSDHGGSFVAAIEKGAVLGCQFHPELSATAGIGLLRRWLEVSSC